MARRVIYGIAEGPIAFYRTLDDFLRRKEVWETRVGFSFVQTALHPSAYKSFKVFGEGDSSLSSDPGVDGGGGIADPMSVHGAGDRAREMVGRVAVIRFNQLKRRAPRPTH